MAKRRHQRTRCKVCGVHMSETRISKRGYCYQHGLEVRLANIEQLENGSGPFYDHWIMRSTLALRRRVIAWEASQQPQGGVQSEP